MEDEKRRRKIAAGREKLAAFRKRKTGEKRNTDSEHSSLSLSDTSLSLSPLPLSETTNKVQKTVQENVNSGSSSISENIELSQSNSENDRSLQEMVVASLALDSPELSSNSVLPLQPDKKPFVSLHNSLLSDSSIVSLNALEKFELENNNCLDSSQNILNEFIKHDPFDSKTDSIQSNPFDDLSSITLKSDRITGSANIASQNELINDSKIKPSEEVIKEPIVQQLSTEIESLKESNSSNPSTFSLGTTTTEYKQYYEKNNLGIIEFQDIISHRDDNIKKLTEALNQVLEDRDNLQEQTDYFAQEIADLREQLVQTTAIIKKNNLNGGLVTDDKKAKDQPSVQLDETDSTSLQSLATDLKIKNISTISFDFEDQKLDETMTPEERKIVAEMRNKINVYIQQKFDEYKHVYESEIKVLRDRLEYEKSRNNKNTEDSVSSLPSTEINEKYIPNQSIIVKNPDETTFDFDDHIFNETFTPEEKEIISDMRSKIYFFIQQKIQLHKNSHDLEIKILKDRLASEKAVHDAEIERLRQLLNSVKTGSIEITDLRQELNEKHGTEMEELRTYFEKRCAEIEKHYSEEIFSQQSRKMSGSSVSELESEIYPAQLGPAGDAAIASSEIGKTDLNSLRIELQNKYHAELEILREDYENRLDELKIGHENYVHELEEKYDVLINALKSDLEEAQKNAVSTQEVASSGDFEIAEVVESYERRLQEQVMLAKIDIVSALEQQIQTLVSSPGDNLEWPSELLQLRDRLTEHWHSEIQEIKDQHAQEIARLKDDHEKSVARALEREKRNSLKNGDDIEIKKERDNLKKATSNLRHLVAELIKYFTKCEDELNNTLVEELLRYGFDKDLSKLGSDFNDSSQSGSEHLEILSPRVKRVHFTPDVSGIINIINESTLENLDSPKDISTEFRSELDLCLARLKSEANAILALSSNLKLKPIETQSGDEPVKRTPVEEKLTSLTRQLITETQVKNELNIQLEEAKGYVENLEADKQSLEIQVEQMMAKQQVLVSELNHAKEKINDLVESGRKEIVSEGYGENQITGSTTLGGRIASLAELQDKARMILAEVEGTSAHPLLQLIEELCREGDRIMEDAKKDHEDLVQQIEAADKKLRATTQFLEDQAVERELERDEAQKESAALREQLREGERTRASCERINKEVERLEVQMREMTVLMAECETKKIEVENELKEAIDKIWVLRDIIKELEIQVEHKTKTEVEFKNIVVQLEDKINYESKQNEELNLQINSLKHCPDEHQYNEIIRKLESENQKLRVSSELIGPDGVLKQVKTQLNEIEKTLEKRTKDLESLHAVISNTNCSSPSEDMSIRDQIRPQSSNECDSDLPLEQLARLKDKLIRHARAEDAAMKRIRDLEMQLYTTKQDYDEMQSERDVLQDQLSEQMVLISSLQLRLDEQRLRVEAAQKQSNTSFEHKIYELETEIQELKEAIHIRDNNIKQMNSVIEQTKKRIAEQEKQLNSASDIEKQMVDQFQTEINRLKSENETVRAKLQAEISTPSKAANDTIATSCQTSNPGLSAEFLDSLLTDKNADIDRLKSKLNDVENELQFYSSLNLTKDQLMQISSIQKSSNITSLVEMNEPDQLRRQEQSFDSIHSGENIDFKRNVNETQFIGSTFRDSKYADKMHSPFVVPELSTIEKVGPPCVNLSIEEFPMSHKESGDSTKSHKHVHFDENLEITHLDSKIKELQQEIERKNETLKTYEINLEKLRQKLQFSDETIREKTENYSDEIDSLKEAEKNLRVDLAEVKMELQQKVNKLDALEKDSTRKDQMFINVAKEKRDLEHKVKELEDRNAEFKNYEKLMEEKNKEIYGLEQQLAELSEVASIESLKESIIVKESEIKHLKKQVSLLEDKFEEKVQELKSFNSNLEVVQQDLSQKNELLLKNDKEHKNILSQCNDLSNHVSKLKDMLDDRCEKILQMERDLEREKGLRDKVLEYEGKINKLEASLQDYKTKLESHNADDVKLNNSQFELEIAQHKKDLAQKELELTQNKSLIEELNKEVHHLQEYLNEKDKIINQITVDSNSLRVALEAIQSKMQESGNVIDLRKRLREEQNLTAALHDELKYLKQSIEHYESVESSNAIETLVLLKESVEREKLTNLELQSMKESLVIEVQKLKQELEIEEDNVRKLKHLLNEEKVNSNMVQLQDANIIESMRLRLEAMLEHENESEKILKIEKKARAELEKQLTVISKPKSTSLESHLKTSQSNYDLTCLKMDLVQLATENEVLKSDLDTIKNLNSLIKTELKQARDLNDAQKLEMNNLKLLVGSMTGSEAMSLGAGNSRKLVADFEDEKNQMKRQIDDLKDTMRKLRDREKELSQLLFLEKNKQMDSPVPEKFLHKMKELKSLLQGHISDNKQMSNTLAQLTEERKSLQNRVRELEDRLNIKTPYDDPVARADHLFGRYLKSESYRKALIFQKRYLLTLLASYQKCSLNLAELNLVLPKVQSSKPFNKFRAAVYAVISIHRMQYIVQRWHTGKRIGASVVTKRAVVPIITSPQPVNFVGNHSDARPWVGNSPPCKDRSTRRAELPLGDTIQESITLAPLQTPALLSEYIERFDSIQQRLGLAIDRSTT